jgi:hypothetical protein
VAQRLNQSSGNSGAKRQENHPENHRKTIGKPLENPQGNPWKHRQKN